MARRDRVSPVQPQGRGDIRAMRGYSIVPARGQVTWDGKGTGSAPAAATSVPAAGTSVPARDRDRDTGCGKGKRRGTWKDRTSDNLGSYGTGDVPCGVMWGDRAAWRSRISPRDCPHLLSPPPVLPSTTHRTPKQHWNQERSISLQKIKKPAPGSHPAPGLGTALQQAGLRVLRPAGGTSRVLSACPSCPRVSPGSGTAPGQPVRSQEMLAGVIHELGTRARLWGRTRVRDTRNPTACRAAPALGSRDPKRSPHGGASGNKSRNGALQMGTEPYKLP